MMTWILRALVIALLTLAFGGLMVLFGEAHWGLAAGGAALAYLLIATLTKTAVKRVFLAPFKAKSKVLAGADLTVHSIEAVPAPHLEGWPESGFEQELTKLRENRVFVTRSYPEISQQLRKLEDRVISSIPAGSDFPASPLEPDEDEEPVNCYMIEATISPVPGEGEFQHWEPAEIIFIDHAALVSFELEEDEGPEGWIEELWIDHGGAWVDDEQGKYVGALKLRMRVLVPRSLERVKLRYYFETFGDLQLPY